jgi:rhodanese-related sulfurtransferase
MKVNKRFSLMVGILVILAFLTACSTAPKEPVAQQAADTSWMFHDIVDAQFVKAQMQIPMPENVMVIDSRPFKPKYVSGHIPMAVSIPDSQFDKMSDQLPQAKDALLIFYCGGLKCKLSHKSARKAEALGYTNVKVFADGFPGWMAVAGNYPAVDTAWVKKQIDSQADMVLVDSRPKRKKYDKGHIPTAISIPDMEFAKLTDQLPADKAKLMVFYCGGFKCKLSHKSAQKAIDLGFTNVKVFAAGYPAWKEVAGAPAAAASVAAATPVAAATQIKAGAEEGSIDIEYFKKLVADSPEKIHVIDVRDADEFANGTLKGAINIPVDALEEKISSLPADKPIVFICGTGARSGESFYMVQDLRPELKSVYYVDAEMAFEKDGSFTITKPVS